MSDHHEGMQGPAPRLWARRRLARVFAAWLLLGSWLGLVTGASTARAEEVTSAPATAASDRAPLAESLRGMARADYAAARILYEDGDFSGAMTKLEAAYEASKDPRLLWNMAACEKQLRHYSSMIALLRRYLAEGQSLIGEDERQAANQLIETVLEFVNQLTLVVEPDGATLFVDDVQVGTSPFSGPVLVDMGKRRIRIEKSGFDPYSTELDLAGGKSMTLSVTLAVEVHEGTLRVLTDPDGVIRIDGKVVGTATWTGRLPSGPHSVAITAPGKQPHQSEVLIKDDDESSMHVNLRAEPSVVTQPSASSSNVWWWVAGGVVAAAGAGVGTYFLLKPSDQPAQPEPGTWGFFQL